MRIIVAGILLSSLVLAACGTNQTEQMNKQPLVKQDNPVEMQKQESTGMAMPESNMSESSSAEVSGTETSSEVAVESTSDNSMINESGIQAAVKEAAEEKAEIVMEESSKDVAKQDEELKKESTEPKS